MGVGVGRYAEEYDDRSLITDRVAALCVHTRARAWSTCGQSVSDYTLRSLWAD